MLSPFMPNIYFYGITEEVHVYLKCCCLYVFSFNKIWLEKIKIYENSKKYEYWYENIKKYENFKKYK